MNFDDTPEEARFRLTARSWIEQNAPHALRETLARAGFGQTEVDEDSLLAAARNWQYAKQRDGWACMDWPAAYGGRDASPIERIIWDQEEGVYARLTTVFVIGQGMCAPTLMGYASEEQKRRHLPRIASGEDIWCQLFSEPSGGSDLAGLRTRAGRVEQGWRINGQKIWTSYAHRADHAILLARTAPELAKHAGLTMFFVDMKSPGIEVRPIRQANGQSEFNEVFLTDVIIPDAQRLGEVNGGWRVALTTLMNERLTVGTGMPTAFPELVALCRSLEIDGRPALEAPAIRARIADWAARDNGLRFTAFRAVSALSQGREPGPENSIGKLVVGRMLQEIATFALDLQGEMGICSGKDHASANGYFQAVLLRSPGVRIEGGTDEILRNIIGERVLGLPPEARVDKGRPFNAPG